MALTHSKPIRLLSLSKALTVTCSANMYQKGIIAQEYAVIGESNRTCAVFSTFSCKLYKLTVRGDAFLIYFSFQSAHIVSHQKFRILYYLINGRKLIMTHKAKITLSLVEPL